MSDKYVVSKSLLDNLNDTISERTGDTKRRTISDMVTDVSTLSPEPEPPAAKPGWTSYPDGVSLGNTITASQLEEIRNGTFQGLGIGDYWRITDSQSSTSYTIKIVDFDYYYGKGQNNVGDAHDTHHVVAVLVWDYEVYMMNLDSSTGDCMIYTDSDLLATGLDSVRNTVTRLVGQSNLLRMKKRLTGRNSTSGSYEDTVWIPCANNIYGYSYEMYDQVLGGENPDDTMPFEAFATNGDMRNGAVKPSSYFGNIWLTNFDLQYNNSWITGSGGIIYTNPTQETAEILVAFLIKG